MNHQESHDDENAARLIQAAFAGQARLDPAARQQAWQSLQETWRKEYGSASMQRPAQAGSPAQTKVSTVEPAFSTADREPSKHQNNNKPERISFMKLLFQNRWRLGFGAAAATAAIVLVIGL